MIGLISIFLAGLLAYIVYVGTTTQSLTITVLCWVVGIGAVGALGLVLMLGGDIACWADGWRRG